VEREVAQVAQGRVACEEQGFGAWTRDVALMESS